MQVTINGTNLNSGIIHTNDNCRGCNKCLAGCPVFSANVAADVEGANKIFVDQRRCTLCGRCMDLCTHEARVFGDDTDAFFNDLAALSSGRRETGISLIVAPAFIINYPQKYNMILGYLKHLGVNHIYSVSLGADITIWGYINYLARHPGKKGMIAQPCPVIVKYIEMYKPALLPHLMPVQSPAMCTAIYLKKYLGIEDDIAFLGPCIAKKSEFGRPQNAGFIDYNVTFDHLMQTLSCLDTSTFHAEDSEIDYGMGAMFSMHGGMRENLEYYLGLDPVGYINQKEGETYSYAYLDLYANRTDFDDPYRAELIDILNCARGCNYGTATEFKHSSSNHIPFSMNRVRVAKTEGAFPESGQVYATPAERLDALNQRFAQLDPADFAASYADEARDETNIGKARIAGVFKEMLKTTEAEQTMDCASCGMRNCKEMATAIALGYNYKENCVHYVKKKLVIERSESALQKQKYELLQASKTGDHLAHIDQLTGLQNRLGFEQHMAKALRGAHQSGMPGYLFMMDLDDFKAINESYGQDFGNSMLMEFANFLKDNFGDTADIFRVSGDEFVVLMENCPDGDARRAADKITRRTQQSWEIFGIRFYCTISMGATRFPDVDDGVNDIIRNVELAMYHAKQSGKNNCAYYTSDMQHDTQNSVEMIRSMRDAVAHGFEGFDLVFQPWVTTTGRVIGCESLLRWQDENQQQVQPDSFIELAESTGLISPMGEYVLRRAAQSCRDIVQAGQPDFLVSVNVSSKQLQRNDVYDRFIQILNETGVNRRNIVLEVTESLGLENVEASRLLFEKFVDHGLTIALDDFGTGYSSLSYLDELPFNLVKIDRAFVQNIEHDEGSRHLLTMITGLMHKLKRRICVEGVENKNQLDFCHELGVDIIQGFYFYKPMPYAELVELIEKQASEG